MDFVAYVRETLAQLSANQIYFVISSAVAYLAFGLIAIWYVWPSIRIAHPR